MPVPVANPSIGECDHVINADNVKSRGGDGTDTHPARFEVRERWEGCVIERLDTYFVATIVHKDSRVEATVEMDLEDVAPGDTHLVEPGALFNWYLGYENRGSRDRTKRSAIRFRRSKARARPLPPAIVEAWLAPESE
jgi:hypothetical protein